ARSDHFDRAFCKNFIDDAVGRNYNRFAVGAGCRKRVSGRSILPNLSVRLPRSRVFQLAGTGVWVCFSRTDGSSFIQARWTMSWSERSNKRGNSSRKAGRVRTRSLTVERLERRDLLASGYVNVVTAANNVTLNGD